MTETYEPREDQPAGSVSGGPDGGALRTGGGGTAWAEGPTYLDAETADLIAQIRQLAAHDPAGVQQVVADVLAALDHATGGGLQPPEGVPLGGGYGDPAMRVADLEAAANPTASERSAAEPAVKRAAAGEVREQRAANPTATSTS